MSKINLTLDITDEMLDESARQLLLGKIRQAVASEIDSYMESTIKQIVEQKVKETVRVLDSKYNFGTKARQRLDELTLDKISELYVDTTHIQATVDKLLRPVLEYTDKKMSEADNYIQTRINMMDKQLFERFCQKLNDVMKPVIDSLFKAADKEQSAEKGD